jgi:hypothetical protein
VVESEKRCSIGAVLDDEHSSVGEPGEDLLEGALASYSAPDCQRLLIPFLSGVALRANESFLAVRIDFNEEAVTHLPRDARATGDTLAFELPVPDVLRFLDVHSTVLQD